MSVELAEGTFLAVLGSVRDSYRDCTFWVERDVVCWMQLRLRSAAPSGMRVFNDFGLLPGPRRARSADLAIVEDKRVLLAAEFKFEPAASRTDIMANKLPVIGWPDVLKDIERIQEFVATGVTPVAWSVCIDEVGRYRARPRPPYSTVQDWDTRYNTQVTLTRWPSIDA